MSLWVQKFGGTSVGSPERICAVARRIAEDHAAGRSLVVVVSAMGHTTDELLSLAHQVSPVPAPREVDMLLTAGERISMALLSMALGDLGIKAVSFTGSQVGIITSAHHRRARIQKILGDRVRQVLQEKSVAIVAGFQGVSEAKEITTLGRGGSDTTAVALAATFQAERCEIFTDVDGVFSADPRIVPGAHLISEVDHEVMVELAQRGAGVLHPRSVELAQKFNVPVWVRNSLKEGQGTQVVSRLEGMEESKVVGVTHDEGKILIEIELMRPSVLGAVMDLATENQITLIAPVFQNGTLRFFMDQDASEEWHKVCQKLSVDGFIKSFQLNDRFVPVSVVGHRLTQDGSVISKILSILDQNSISVTMGQANSLAVTLVVARHHAKDAVLALHEGLFSKD
jgi:aspartate kinase